MLLRQLARYVVRKAASDPVIRERAVHIARGVVDEARQIAGKEDRALATGQAVRRAWEKLREGR